MDGTYRQETTVKQHTPQNRPDETGIPVQMRQAFEQETGISFADVRVHYRSSRPRELGARAYAQGNHVYLGPGQEQHLGHELGHVAQQKRGWVTPTGRVGGVPVNDDPRWEQAADQLAQRAARSTPEQPVQRLAANASPGAVVQRLVGVEFQLMGEGCDEDILVPASDGEGMQSCPCGARLKEYPDAGFSITGDGGSYEFVTEAVDERTDKGVNDLQTFCKNAAKAKRTLPAILGVGEETQDRIEGYKQYKNGSQMYYVRKPSSNRAHPQATMGLRLDRLFTGVKTLIERMDAQTPAGPRERTPQSITDLYVKYGGTKLKLKDSQKMLLKELKNKGEDLKVQFPGKTRETAMGLMLLLGSMARGTADYYKTMKVPVNAKSAMPLMARTSLYEVYRKLDQADRDKILECKQGEPGNLLLNYIAGKSQLRKQPDGTVANKKEGTTILDTVLALEKRETGGLEMVTLGQWLENLPEQGAIMESPFSQRKMDGIDKIYDGKNMYSGMECATDIGQDEEATGKKVEGMLVELRHLQRGVKSKDWGTFGRDVALLCRVMNGGTIR